ncbi:hypothetical protein [Oceanicola sp. D3]|uniref:hypothetical protein n=1 Tax=Oceanicola sp. D3 TaxID=2587163 RepID=UPI00143DBAAB|nr:hypothetical protein [Oceanicola sp. D3]
MIESKADHSSWFIENWGPGGRPEPKSLFHKDVLLAKIHKEATEQAGAVGGLPQVRLTWHFSEMVFKIYFMEWLLANGLALTINTVHFP